MSISSSYSSCSSSSKWRYLIFPPCEDWCAYTKTRWTILGSMLNSNRRINKNHLRLIFVWSRWNRRCRICVQYKPHGVRINWILIYGTMSIAYRRAFIYSFVFVFAETIWIFQTGPLRNAWYFCDKYNSHKWMFAEYSTPIHLVFEHFTFADSVLAYSKFHFISLFAFFECSVQTYFSLFFFISSHAHKVCIHTNKNKRNVKWAKCLKYS